MFCQPGSLVVNDQQFAFMERGWLEGGKKGGSHWNFSLQTLQDMFLCMHVPKSK